MIRNILSVIAGIATGWVFFTVIQMISHALSPTPPGFDYTDMGSIKELIDGMPIYAWIILIFGYVIGSFAGGFVVGKIAESKTIIFPVILSLFYMMGWLTNIMSVPHPMWVVVIVFIVYVPCALAGHKLAVVNPKEA